MRHIILALLASFSVELLAANQKEVRTLRFDSELLSISSVECENGSIYSQLEYKGIDTKIEEPGMPELPIFYLNVSLPLGATNIDVNVQKRNCDMSVQCNQIGNLVTMVNGSNSFPNKPYNQWTGLTLVSTTAPSGTTSGRPANAAAGTYYFDTTIGKPIWSKGNGQWTNASGTIV